MTEFISGFENGTIASGATSEWQPLGTTPTINTTTPRTGTNCGRCAATTTGTSNMTASVSAGVSTSFSLPYAARFAFRVNTLPASNTEEFCQLPEGKRLRISSAGVIAAWSSVAQLAAGSTTLSTGTWYVVEVFTDASGNTKVRVYADGSPAGADELTCSSTAQSGTFILGKVVNRNGNTVSFDYDDVRVKDTSPSTYLGDGKNILVKGNSTTPTYDAFTKTSSLRIDQVWNDTPFSATNNASSSANADTKQTIKHNATGIGASDTINTVATKLVAKKGISGTAVTVEELHRVGGSDATSSITLGTSDTLFQAFWPSIPSLTDLDASEVGVFRHVGGTISTTVEDAWLEVDYSLSTGRTGSLAATLAAVTLSAAGQVIVKGALGLSLADVVAAGAGLAQTLGSLVQTLAAVTLASAGGSAIHGTLARTLAAMRSSSTATARSYSPIVRRQDWPTILAQMVYDARCEPFAWGTHDCCIWAADVIQAMSESHVDLAATYRGTYSDEAGAAAVISAATGGGDLEDLIEAIATANGFIEVTPNKAQRGDLALADTVTGPAAGIIGPDGRQGIFVAPDGLTLVDLTDIRRTWRI
jgi:hypothetical protein